MWKSKSVAGIDIALEEETCKKRQHPIDQRDTLIQRVENTIDMYLRNAEKRLHMHPVSNLGNKFLMKKKHEVRDKKFCKKYRIPDKYHNGDNGKQA